MIEYREDKEFEEAQLECLFLSVQRESGRFAKKAGAGYAQFHRGDISMGWLQAGRLGSRASGGCGRCVSALPAGGSRLTGKAYRRRADAAHIG